MSGARTRVTIRVKDHGLEQLRRELIHKRQATVEVGVGGEAGSHEVMKAAVNELGSDDGHIPERSFLRSTLNENRDRYINALRRLAGKVAQGETTFDHGLRLLGEAVQRDVLRKIDSGIAPENAPSTVKAKESDHTLVDTGSMRRNVRYKVKIE